VHRQPAAELRAARRRRERRERVVRLAGVGHLAQIDVRACRAIDAVRPLILSSWSEALPHVAMVVLVMIVFDALCLYGGAKAFRRAMG